MAYPLLNTTTTTGIFSYANLVTDNLFGIGILVAVYFAFLIYQVLNGVSFAKGLVSSGWVGLIVSIFFILFDIINGAQLVVMVSVFVLSLVFAYFVEQ